jgi:hypothetical protein
MWINCLIQTIVLQYWSKLICIQKLHKIQKKEGNRNGGEWIKDRIIIGWNWSEGDYRGSSKNRYIHKRRIHLPGHPQLLHFSTSPCWLSLLLFIFLALYSISSIPVFKIAKRRSEMLKDNSYTTERTLLSLQRRIKDKLVIVSYCVSRINPKSTSFNGRSCWKI